MIYGLVHPDTLEVRYVGKTVRPEARLKSHAAAARRGVKLPVYYWWNKCLAQVGHAPSFVRLGEGDSAEEIRWIADLRAQGARLLNLTAGGDGLVGLPRSPEHCARISATLTGRRGLKHTPEARANMARSHLGRIFSPETREKIRAAQRGKPRPNVLSPESRAKISAALKGKPKSLETRVRMSAAKRRNSLIGRGEA
jgi:hypothetical protein